ncbi:peptide deformylase [Bifidobacterium margollesii]|uniref:Peptide deformylase n=1 Tax=Bifidobacterium margollesii TaxID=2020964 RepID=A0A2N5J760_9BIFI|nr:peptide deformylase [Bifidobacterium margollesii]PLS30034.1 peptide deformylase [Bifidobacterium margollesii]
MAIREIRVVPDPVLRTPCDPIREITPAIGRLVDDLLETVNDPGRAGLSANQIGVSLRAFSYNIEGRIGYILNPVIEETRGEQYGDEGCLSVPGLWYKTRRADYARVSGIDLDGKPVTLEGSGLMGRMLQHECDHLDGHVYLDRLEKEERREAMRMMRRQQTR